MDLAAKLQIKPGSVVATIAAPDGGPDLAGVGQAGSASDAQAVIAFVHSSADLPDVAQPAIEAARDDKVAWVAYPKAGQLGTDLSRDTLAAAMRSHGVRPVRQVALDDVWSALRFRPA
jgi:hypothetical protein